MFISLQANVDLFTVISVLGTNFYFTEEVAVDQIETLGDFVAFSLYLVNTVRILRILRVQKDVLETIEDPVDRFLRQMVLSLVTMILFGRLFLYQMFLLICILK